MTRNAAELAEIERHKYLLSEKSGYDVGWEFAERDWDQHHAAQWRQAQAGQVVDDQAVAVAVQEAPPKLAKQPRPAQRAAGAEPEQRERSTQRPVPEQTPEAPVSWFRRCFSWLLPPQEER